MVVDVCIVKLLGLIHICIDIGVLFKKITSRLLDVLLEKIVQSDILDVRHIKKKYFFCYLHIVQI